MNIAPKFDKLRHRILFEINKKPEALKKELGISYMHESQINISVKELAQRLNVSPDEILNASALLQKNEDIRFSQIDGEDAITPWTHSFSSFEKKYLKEGTIF